MGFLNDRSDLIDNEYVQMIVDTINKINANHILDLGQGCQGKTAYYLHLYFGHKKSPTIYSVVQNERTKRRVINELSDNSCKCIHVIKTKYDTDEIQKYDVDWKQVVDYKFDFIIVDAPYLSEAKTDIVRVDIMDIISAGKLEQNKPFAILFHDASDTRVQMTIAKTKQLLKNTFVTKAKDMIVLSNVKL